MAISVKSATPCIVEQGDTMLVNWADGSQQEIQGGPDALQAWINDNLPDINGVRALFLSHCLANDPLLNTPSVWDGKTATFDPEQTLAYYLFKVVQS